MRKTKMYQKSIATDLAFSQELSIYGDFIQVPKVLFRYFGRKKWNTVHQDYQVFFGKDRKPWWYLPFIALFCNHWKRVGRAPISFSAKLCLWKVLLTHEVGQTVLKILIKTSGFLCPERWKKQLGCAIYRQWMHSPNIQVGCADLFFERVIKPRLRWWENR